MADIIEPNLTLRMINGQPVLDRTLADGRWLSVHPLLFERACLLMGRPEYREQGEADRVWEFASFSAAVAVLAVWNGEGEPAGWDRSKPVGPEVFR